MRHVLVRREVKDGRAFARFAQGMAIASTLGLGFASATALGIYLGVRCDRALGVRPIVCTTLLGLAGGAAGLTFILRTIRSLERRRPPRSS